MFYNLCRSTAF